PHPTSSPSSAQARSSRTESSSNARKLTQPELPHDPQVLTIALDGAGRVTEVQGPRWSETYVYDQAGNQSHAVWPNRHTSPEARGDRTYLGTRLTGAGSVRYVYDPAGRVSQRRKTRLSHKPDLWRYTWDAEDRLTSVTTPEGTTWRYGYDPMGRRTVKRRMAPDGVTVIEETRFTWDGTTVVEQTTSGPGLPAPTTLTWDYAGTSPIAQTERRINPATQEEIDARFFAIITDLVGTPTELLDDSGRIAWQTRSTLWGLTTWRADSSAYTPLRFPGQYYDFETGLHYNYQRYYDPETARYASPDPLGLHPAPNPVAYVVNPHTWADPLGLGPYQVGQILGNTSQLGGWIPTSVPDESLAVLRDIREFGVEAQGAGPQLRGPSIPQRFENSGRGGGYQLPQFDNAGQEIRYTEWGTVQSADNPNWGGERIVTGSDGSAYYTPTHYQTWIVMEAGR
ncbi:RHS repeat-associated core domain-containing protein, partial [Streptomyces sp. DSM 44938]